MQVVFTSECVKHFIYAGTLAQTYFKRSFVCVIMELSAHCAASQELPRSSLSLRLA